MLTKPILLLTSLLLSSSAYAATEQAMNQRIDFLMGAKSHQRYHRFFSTFQQGVIQQDKTKVASLISYPLTAPVQGKDRVITNKHQFIRLYPQIFTPTLRQVVKKQQYRQLFANSSGVMIGQRGEIWFSGICEDTGCKRYTLKVIRINAL